MSETYQHIYVSAGDINNSPYYDFYTDASGSQELTPTNTLYLDTSYVFHRLDEATSHPFYISDVSYEEPHSSNIQLTGDGSYNDGIIGTETLTLEFTGLDTSDNLYYYCTAHSNMINSFTLVATTPIVDSTAPTLTSIIPLLDASNVTIDSSFVFVFSENVVDTSGNITIFDGSNNIVEVIDVSSVNVSIVDNEVTVNPTSDLNYNTSYYVNIDSGVFEDEAGNAFTGLDSSSNTGMRFTTELDTYGPVLTSINPTLDSSNVLINTSFLFTFDENITDGSGNITIYDGSDNVVEIIDVSSARVSIANNEVVVDPSFDLSYSTLFYVNIDSGTFEDEAGNAFTGLDSSTPNTGMRFITEEAPDITAPSLISFSPALNATDVSVNTDLVFTFDEVIVNSGLGSITIHDASTNDVSQILSGFNTNISISGEIVTITPLNDLSYNMSYYVNIDSTIFQDEAGNPFPGLDSSSNTGMRFTTEIDVYKPVLESISPELNATDALIDTQLVFNFDENVLVGSGNITLYDSSSNTILQVFDVSSSDVSIVGSQVTVTLQQDLSFNTSYYVNVDAGTFEDSVGNSFVGLDSSSTSGMRFTTSTDYIGPVITSISPLLNATDVSVNSNLEFVFNEDISLNEGSITILDASTNLTVQTFNVSSSNVDISGNQAIVNLPTDLPFGASLYVNIASGVFQDGLDNNFLGLNSSNLNTGMRFTTEPDVTPPTLISVSPALNATDVSINSNLVFTFNENIVNATGNIYIYDAFTNVLLNTFDVTGPNVSILGNQVTLNPTTDLSFNRYLYVNIDSGAFEDEAGNIYTGLNSSVFNVGMRFTTELDVTIPTILSFSPALNASNVLISQNLVFTFSETILPGNGFITIKRVSDNAIVRKISVFDLQVNITNNRIVLNPTDDLPYNTSLYVNIDAGFVKDLRENNFVGLDSSSPDTGIRFTTERDLLAPSLVSFTPVKDATNVSLNTNLEFTFSEDVSANSGNIFIHRTSNDIILQIIDVTSSNVTISGRDAVVNLSRSLPSDLSIYVNIDTGAFQDGPGNQFVGLNSSSPTSGMRFKTRKTSVPRSNTPPTLVSILPTLNETNVRLDTALIFTFSKDVIAVSGNIEIYNANNNTILQTIDVHHSRVKINGKKVTVMPPVYLPDNTPIYVNISSNAFLDVDGNNYAGLDSSIPGSGMRFTTVNLAQTRLFDIIKFCQDRKCQQNIQYNRLKTGGNDPSMSAAMRYAQYVRGTKPRSNQST